MGDARNRTFAISYILFLVASSHAAWSQPKRDHDDIFWGLGQVSPAASAPVEDNPSWPPRFASNHDRDSFFVGKLALALRAKERCGKHLAPMFYMVFAVAKIEGMSDQSLHSLAPEVTKTLDGLRYPDDASDVQWCELVENLLLSLLPPEP